jgi:uncharacterized radical SAM superfamily Fe-S cluster-containing enzyme
LTVPQEPTVAVTPPAAGSKVDRDEVFVEYTKSICPVCKIVVDAEVNARNNKLYLRKRCPAHGRFEALVYSRADWYFESQRFNKPGTIPLQTQTEVVAGCPLDCGLCPEHKQHACLGILEVNSGCNLDCPICFAGSGHQPDGFSLTMDQVEAGLDAFIRSEGEPEVVMFSGGEPTIHPQILDFIAMAKDKGIPFVTLNTNGVRLAKDHAFGDALARLDPSIYLQFDGFDEQTHLRLRGRDLRAVKEAALERCAALGLKVSLVAAVEAGINDHEVGAIVALGLRHPAVRSVVFQPVTHAGRHLEFDPLTRLTNPDVIEAIADQLPHWFKASDFFPVPCCFPSCRSVSYVLSDGDQVVPLTRLLPLDDYLDYITNRVLPHPAIRAPLEQLWSASAVPGSTSATSQLECVACGLDPPAGLDRLAERTLMIVVQDFQDAYTLNVRQLMKCCVVEIVPDGRLIPFCAYNSVGYREQVREQLSGVAVPAMVPNATELQPILKASAYRFKTAGNGARHLPGEATNRGRRLP